MAEELIGGKEKVTTGASDDLRKATELALRIVKQFGMGPALRDYTVELEKNRIVAVSDIGPTTLEALDKEVNVLLDEAYTRAKEILTKHKVIKLCREPYFFLEGAPTFGRGPV